jgi:hypothetical protein
MAKMNDLLLFIFIYGIHKSRDFFQLHFRQGIRKFSRAVVHVNASFCCWSWLEYMLINEDAIKSEVFSFYYDQQSASPCNSAFAVIKIVCSALYRGYHCGLLGSIVCGVDGSLLGEAYNG